MIIIKNRRPPHLPSPIPSQPRGVCIHEADNGVATRRINTRFPVSRSE